MKVSKVSDKDLKHLLVLEDCFGGGHEVAKAVYDELLALRKVADAAAVIMMTSLRGDGATYHRNMPEYDSLYDALKESGQWR